MHECLMLEVSPGSGRLTACLKRCQFENSFSVDCAAGKCCAPRIVVDLSTEAGRMQFSEILSEESLIYVHFVPPTNTTSRARLRQYAGAPAVLRSDASPDGVPGLSSADQGRLDRANCHVKAVAAACSECAERGILFSIANPENSFLWATKAFKVMLQQVPVFVTRYHLCSYGSPHKKPMRIVHTLPRFLELHNPCDGGHAHKFWPNAGAKVLDKDVDFPWGLCQRMAQLLQDQMLDFGAQPVPTELSRAPASVASARAAAGWQSNKRVLPLVPEFKLVATVSGKFEPKQVQAFKAGDKLPAPWEVPATASVDPCYLTSVPTGSKVLRILVSTGESAKGCGCACQI